LSLGVLKLGTKSISFRPQFLKLLVECAGKALGRREDAFSPIVDLAVEFRNPFSDAICVERIVFGAVSLTLLPDCFPQPIEARFGKVTLLDDADDAFHQRRLGDRVACAHLLPLEVV
jgi:hypothetical protein